MGQSWTKVKQIKLMKDIKHVRFTRHKPMTDDDFNPEFGGGNVHLVTTVEMWDKETTEAYKAGKVVVVNFSASWCVPCRQIAVTYRELADKYTSILFLTIDVDELAEFSTTWDVKATPTIYFLRDGRQLDKIVGANKVELQKKVAAIVESTKRMSSS